MKIISVNDNTYVRHWFRWYLMIKAGKHGDYAIIRPSRKTAR